MKKQILAALVACLFLLTACGQRADEENLLQIVATTYPVYLFATAVTEGVEGVEVTLLVNQPTACLHDYTLTVKDMQTIERADVLVMNGAGLEDFMADALAQTEAETIDCSVGVPLLLAEEHEGHDGHDHAEEYDPHYWMDPQMAMIMVGNIEERLTELDANNGEKYQINALRALTLLNLWDSNLRDLFDSNADIAPADYHLITFHEGFRYFAEAYDLTLLKAIEEEEGSETSAMEIKEMVGLIEQHNIPVIFTERNGSAATANAIARECGVTIAELTMLMSGEEADLSTYLDGLMDNAQVIINGFAGREVLVREHTQAR